jgi:hypothetical protein
MAGNILDRQLTARAADEIRFTLAVNEDDTAIRRLLRENPMRGEITLSFEREPNYFRGFDIEGVETQTILACKSERLLCMGRCSTQRRFVNGQIRRVGYLADLRLDTQAQGRFDILRRGYQFFRELHHNEPPNFYFTSIASDNHRSIRMLERGLPGMPTYEFLCDFVTLPIPVSRNTRKLQQFNCTRGSSEYLAELVSCLNSQAKQNQLAAFWTEDDLLSLKSIGLALSDFQLVLDGNKVIACAVLWDQRSFRQIVVREYSRKISFARPWLNLAAKLFGALQLPPENSSLAFGLISPLSVAQDQPELALALIRSILPIAAERGLEFCAVGFATGDSRLEMIRNHFRCREYNTRLYRVRWNDADADSPVPDGRPFLPELAFL